MIKRRTRNKWKRSKKAIIVIITITIVVIVVGIYILYRFHQDREQEMTESDWVNVELHYIGSAKMVYDKKNYGPIDNERFIRTDGELTYTYGDYYFLDDYTDYQRMNQWYEFYDADFDPRSALEKGRDSMYVFSLGRKLEWLQYNPNEISQFGRVMNRAGKEWDAEIEEDMVYFYEFEYSGEHYLADVSMEF